MGRVCGLANSSVAASALIDAINDWMLNCQANLGIRGEPQTIFDFQPSATCVFSRPACEKEMDAHSNK